MPRLVHPTKVCIIEAVRWIDRPLSAAELERVFDGELSVPVISYHLKTLAAAEDGVSSAAVAQSVRRAR